MSKKRRNQDGGGDDQPATRDQIEYLRRLANLSEEELAKLGKWEASDLIDRLREQQRATDEAMLAPGRRAGCIKGVVIVVLLAAIGGILWLMFHNKGDVGPPEPQVRSDRVERAGKSPAKPALSQEGKPKAPETRASARPVAPPPEPIWPPKKFPTSYRTTQPVELLAADGSGVVIGAGQTLDVIEPTRPNVWKFRHGGSVLIGSGGRVEGKLAPVEMSE